MATITAIGASDMGAVLTCAGGAVVATKAGAYYVYVIDLGGRCPAIRIMAGFTAIAGLNMAYIFGAGVYTVMATKAAPAHVAVIKLGR